MSERVDRPVCICITAPTASGKTELALALAERWPVEIISMDSAMVYRGLDVGTAKPSLAERARVPHHLVDIVEPYEPYSAGRFAADARRVIKEVRARGRLPLVVGGTLLYLRALREGLAPLPERDDAVRSELDAEAARLGWPALHARLAEVDPASAARIAQNDRQRIQRALEVHALTGRSLSAFLDMQRSEALPMLTLALMPDDRDALAARVERRFDDMVAAGFIDEVRRLMARGDLTADLPSMRAVGYRQLWAHLAGDYDWDEARRKAIVATRRLAKRQMTWLRSEAHILRIPAFARGLEAKIAREIASTDIFWA